MLQPVRGTHDVMPDEMRQLQWLLAEVRRCITLYNYDEIATPIFEFSHIFHRLGASSDVVTKETYTFQDRGGEDITLRPEGTAGVARAVISNGLTQQLPLKYFYTGPMFRYDRPQKGRYRQFDQIGLEYIGSAHHQADCEVITVGWQILQALGIGQHVKLEINTIGDSASRLDYRAALVNYFTRYKNDLSEDSQRRLGLNPLRILDSKDAGDRKLLVEAPRFADYLSAESQHYFERVCQSLQAMGIHYTHNPLLVRGLDYYCHTAFEFVSSALGAQGTVLAGGRYDGLIEQLGGPAIPAVGWAGGVGRMLLLADKVIAKQPPLLIIPMGDAAEHAAVTMAQELRGIGHPTEIMFGGTMAKRLKRADRMQAPTVILLGDDELRDQNVFVKHLQTGQQETVAISALTAYFKSSH